MRGEECVVRSGPGNWLEILIVRRGRRRGGGPAANLRPHQTSRLQTPDVSAERSRVQAAGAKHWLMTNFRSCPTIIIQIADN